MNSVHPCTSSCFLLFFYFSFPPYKKCHKNSGKNTGKISVQEASRRAQEGPEGSQGGPGGHPARPHPWPCQGAPGAPGPPLAAPPSPIYSPSRENSKRGTLFCNLASVPPPRFRDREHQKTSSRHPAGGRIDLRESPLHHGCSPDVS